MAVDAEEAFCKAKSDMRRLSTASDKDQALVAHLKSDSDASECGEEVALQVYDAMWLLARTRFDAVHLGVELYGSEISFGDLGVRRFEPGSYDRQRHRERIVLGKTKFTRAEVVSLLLKIKGQWPGSRYRLIGCNCQTFAIALCEELGLGGKIPEKYTFFSRPLELPIGVQLNDLIPDFVATRLSSIGSGSSSSGSSGSCSGSTVIGLQLSNNSGSCTMDNLTNPRKLHEIEEGGSHRVNDDGSHWKYIFEDEDPISSLRSPFVKTISADTKRSMASVCTGESFRPLDAPDSVVCAT